LFIELPLKYARGAVFSVAWRAVGVGRFLAGGASRMLGEGVGSPFSVRIKSSNFC
jgi:hypothetical protein